MRRTLIAVAAFAAAALAGCGDASPPSAADGGSAAADPHSSWDVTEMADPCRTVTAGDVTAATGLAVTGGERLDSWPPLCTFIVTGPQEYLYVSDDSRGTAKDDFTRQHSDSSATEDVSGIGDQAYWLPEYTALHVLRGPTHLAVKFAGSNPPAEAKAKALALAQVVLPRATPAPSPS